MFRPPVTLRFQIEAAQPLARFNEMSCLRIPDQAGEPEALSMSRFNLVNVAIRFAMFCFATEIASLLPSSNRFFDVATSNVVSKDDQNQRMPQEFKHEPACTCLALSRRRLPPQPTLEFRPCRHGIACFPASTSPSRDSLFDALHLSAAGNCRMPVP